MADPNIPESSEESKARHTPGPWFNWNDLEELGGIYAKADNGIGNKAVAILGRGWSDEQIEANARLIAAAPEMLEVLKRYHQAAEGAWNELVSQGGEDALVQSGRESLDATAALIAKAEGT